MLHSKFAEGNHAEIMEVILRGGLEVEHSMADPLRKFTAMLTKVLSRAALIVRRPNVLPYPQQLCSAAAPAGCVA